MARCEEIPIHRDAANQDMGAHMSSSSDCAMEGGGAVGKHQAGVLVDDAGGSGRLEWRRSVSGARSSRRTGISATMHQTLIFACLMMASGWLLGPFPMASASDALSPISSPSKAAMSSPAYANSFEVWNCYNAQRRVTSSPVTFRVQCETRFGWEVCVTGGCEALGYWDPTRALLLKTDPHRYPIWEGVAQLPGGCDMDYKFLMRMTKTPQTTEWEPCPNRQLRTRASEKAVILVTDPDNVDPDELAKQEQGVSNYFSDYTTLAAPYSSTVIFNTARPQEDFKEMLEDEAFQKPCALVFCRDSGTEIFVRDYETPTIEGMGGGEQLLETRPDDRELLEAGADVNELD